MKELLVAELQDLLGAEDQIVGALPKMIEAAHCTRLREAFGSEAPATTNVHPAIAFGGETK